MFREHQFQVLIFLFLTIPVTKNVRVVIDRRLSLIMKIFNIEVLLFYVEKNRKKFLTN